MGNKCSKVVRYAVTYLGRKVARATLMLCGVARCGCRGGAGMEQPIFNSFHKGGCYLGTQLYFHLIILVLLKLLLLLRMM